MGFARASHRIRGLTASAALLFSAAAPAIQFEFDYGEGITGTLNTVVTVGAAVRMQDRSGDLVGKANNNPNVCGGANQSCQGLFKGQNHPGRALANGVGQATSNADNGNLNYDKGDLTQAPFKVTQDLSLNYGDFGFFAKWLYFYDFVNNDFTETHPNRITAENRDRVGITGDDFGANLLFERVYGPGEVVREQRTDPEVLRQIGTDLQLFDFYFFGKIPLGEERELGFKIGRQTINWGESTVLLINSINQVNAVNANNLFRVGFDLSELFTPSNMITLSTELFANATIEAFYGLEWEPVEIPAPGGYYSFADIGTNGAIDSAIITFGGGAEDHDICATELNPVSGCGRQLANPLSGLTNTSTRIQRLEDNEPSDTGQFGISMKYFAEGLGNGTEFGFYFLNYHSKLPYVSEYAADASCARADSPRNELGADAHSGPELLLACPDLPFSQHNRFNEALNGPPGDALSNAVPIDTVKFLLEYPENIQMYGVSFNTTIGDLSLQGEVAYRPNLPVQVDAEDLTFAALQPLLTRCPQNALPGGECVSSTAGIGVNASGGQSVYPGSDFTPYPGTGITPYPDTFDLAIGHATNSARSFPAFVNTYRGIAPGETPPNSYIRGFEEFGVYQFNLGATYVQGATDNWLGADQVIWLFELGAQWVPDLPDTSVLQVESPGTYYHASAGADGSQTGNYAQDCAGTINCNFGADGLRFNPHQENLDAYADRVSTGAAMVTLIRYESVFPGISFQPIIIAFHDISGTSVDVAAQFTEGRTDIIALLETRYKESLSFNLGYTWFTGGGVNNLQKDRDQALGYVKYQF